MGDRPGIVGVEALDAYVRVVPELHIPGLRVHTRGVIVYRCPVCRNEHRSDDEYEPICTGPNATLDDHEPAMMAVVELDRERLR